MVQEDTDEDISGGDEVGHFDDVGGGCHPLFRLLSSCVVQHHDVIYVYDDEEQAGQLQLFH